MAPLTYLITGTSQGLGHGLVKALLLRPDTTIIAAVRDPSHPNAASLNNLPHAQNSKLIIVKIDSKSATDPFTVATQLQTTHSITSIDTVIANAGISSGITKVIDARAENLLEHFQVNAVGVVHLYQAIRPLLLRSSSPKFIATSGLGGSIAAQDKIAVPIAEYGPSRAALNWLVRKIHFEEEKVASVLVNPGLIDTQSGRLTVEYFGFDPKLLMTVDDAVGKYLSVVDVASKEEFSGLFIDSADHSVLPW